MNKLNLIIDFNNLLMRSISTPGMTFYNSDYEDENDLNDIVKKLTIDICYNIRLFTPDKVIIVCDSPNAWRKDILPKDESGYKANRIKDEKKNWTNLWNKMDKFKKHLSNIGFVISEVPRAEADDLAALWKEKLYALNNESILFISSDKDWRQLADYNKLTNSFVSIFNPTVNNRGKKKLFVTNETLKYLTNKTLNAGPDAIFNLSDNRLKNNIERAIMSDTKISVEIIDPFSVLIEKIFEGDAGDNVPSFYEYYKTTKRGTQLAKVTPTVVKKLRESLHIDNIDDLNGAAKYLVHQLEKIMKIDNIPVESEDRLNRQKILVELNTSLFPDNIISEFNNTYVDLYNKENPKNLVNIKWINVLDNTEFFDKKEYNRPKEDKVFNDLGGDFNKYFKGLF